LTAPNQAAERSEARVFIQLVKMADQRLPKPLGSWLRDNAVAVNSVSGFVVVPGTPTVVPSIHCLDSECLRHDSRTLAITCDLPAASSESLKCSLRFEHEANESNEPRTVSFETHDQEPVVVQIASNDKFEGSQMILTPYVVSDRQHMGRLLECKDQERRSAMRP
jgi:hypothetical protein